MRPGPSSCKQTCNTHGGGETWPIITHPRSPSLEPVSLTRPVWCPTGAIHVLVTLSNPITCTSPCQCFCVWCPVCVCRCVCVCVYGWSPYHATDWYLECTKKRQGRLWPQGRKHRVGAALIVQAMQLSIKRLGRRRHVVHRVHLEGAGGKGFVTEIYQPLPARAPHTHSARDEHTNWTRGNVGAKGKTHGASSLRPHGAGSLRPHATSSLHPVRLPPLLGPLLLLAH